MANKGILGRKLGMTQVFDDANRVDPGDRHRGRALSRRAAQDARARRLRRGAARVRRDEGVAADQAGARSPEGRGRDPPQKYLAELRVDDLSGFELGQIIEGRRVRRRVSASTSPASARASGFAGVMKRHNFSGQGASHGNHKKHRAPGSIGACATPARVFKGMKMAGQFGNTQGHDAEPAGRRRRRRARAAARSGARCPARPAASCSCATR